MCCALGGDFHRRLINTSIIDLAQIATFDRWRQELRGIATTLDDNGGYNPAEDPTNNWVKLAPTFDGCIDITGHLVGELAFRIKQLVDAETERVVARYRTDAEHIQPDRQRPVLPARKQARAEALAELLERGAGTPDGQGRLPQPELTVTYNTDTETLTDDTGENLSVSMLRWLIAAAIIRPLQTSQAGDPLRMGNTLRYANREQRRALTIRDGGCIFPGCTRPPSWCDAHHVDHWDHGGPTDVENMALLCRHHHRITHQPHWHMQRAAADYTWTTPRNRTVHSQRHQTVPPPE